MIKKYIFPALLLGWLSFGTLSAEPAQPEKVPPARAENEKREMPPPPHMRKVSQKEVQMLKTLFLMSDKELARMRELITKLEQTPVAKRRKMAEALERAGSDNPAEREKLMEEMRHRFESRRKNLLERYYATLPEDKAKAEAEAFLKMTRREQFEYMNTVREKLGLPTPRRNGERAQSPGPRPNAP
ncbi:MAG: hypothetical protein IKW49_04775 [Opitutales bacterium]|nr:hypothetical protein [Opitutales bacterium]